MAVNTGEPTLDLMDLSVVPTDKYPLVHVVTHNEFALCAYAFDTEAEGPVFIKVKDAAVASNGLRMAREAEILDTLSHPQIPRLIEADTSEDQPFPYVVSEVKPGSAHPGIRLDKQPAPRLAAQLCLSALEPLAHTHDQGITHRDVKPENLLMMADGRGTSLVDFELGLWDHQPSFLDRVKRLVGFEQEDKGRITQVGRVVGTAAYMSPERTLGKRGTAQSDIYSMGVVLYRLLYGHVPFSGSNVEISKQHFIKAIDFSGTDRVIPDALVGIMETATQKDPKDRYESAGAMGEALERYITDMPIAA